MIDRALLLNPNLAAARKWVGADLSRRDKRGD
jgi:hypothetical protein